MKRIVLGLAVALVPLMADAAHAISRYNSTSLTCERNHQILDRENAAILRYQSKRSGVPLYDRYVSNGTFCPSFQYQSRTTIPAADTASCPVYQCKQSDIENPFDR